MNTCSECDRSFECPFCGGAFTPPAVSGEGAVRHDATPCPTVAQLSAAQFLDRVTRVARCAAGHVYGVARPQDRQESCPFCAQGAAADAAYQLYRAFEVDVARRARCVPRRRRPCRS